jgi:ABC-type transport system involved in multi-copper enzyme maturation permease subunit
MYCNLVICAAGSYYTFSEKKQNLMILCCSLPVNRRQIVLAKYLTTLVIVLVGIVVFALVIVINYWLNDMAARDFYKMIHPKIAFISLYQNVIFFSMFLPSVFFFRLFGMALTFSIAAVSSIYSYILLFRPDRFDFRPYFTAESTINTLIAILLMCSMSVLSMNLTLKIFEQKNL